MTAHECPRGYRVRVARRLDDTWAAWFDGFTLRAADDGTTLVSGLVDQAQLHGVFAKLRDLGLEIVSVDATDGPTP